jgi:hypothetical protein
MNVAEECPKMVAANCNQTRIERPEATKVQVLGGRKELVWSGIYDGLALALEEERMTMDSYWASRPWPSNICLTLPFQAQPKYLKGLFILFFI